MRPTASRRAFAILGLLAATSVASLPAEERQATYLTHSGSHIKTQDTTFVVDGAWADAFSLTHAPCNIDNKGCILRIEVSSTFEQIQPGAVAMIRVRVDGTPALPVAQVEVDSTSSGSLSNAHTFTWMKRDIPNGDHVVDVEFGMAGSGAAAIAGARTLTIEVLKTLPINPGPLPPTP